jgi:hypothetical protein
MARVRLQRESLNAGSLIGWRKIWFVPSCAVIAIHTSRLVSSTVAEGISETLGEFERLPPSVPAMPVYDAPSVMHSSSSRLMQICSGVDMSYGSPR